MFVEERFELSPAFKSKLRRQNTPFGFNGLGELTFFTRYSRRKEDGTQETWADCVIRVIESTFSIFKDQYKKNSTSRYGRWQDVDYTHLAEGMATYMFHGKWTPPGRGLWAHGPYVWERGAMALQNCCYTANMNLPQDLAWTMDALMCGVGAGFDTRFTGTPRLYDPREKPFGRTYIIPDSREGWVQSVYMLAASYLDPVAPCVAFDYSAIRLAGEPIRGFGGTASGPEPLMKLHERMRRYFNRAVEIQQTRGLTHGDYTRLSADLYNAVGACVVAGNVRRSAEIALGNLDDEVFLNLKNYEMYPERAELGWMSNNSVALWEPLNDADATRMAERIIDNGEPGFINFDLISRYARLGEFKMDRAMGINPCGEIPLEDHEICCLSEVFLPRCTTAEEAKQAFFYASMYATIVSLLPTHSDLTNEVVQRNHRIGVSVTGVADFFHAVGEKYGRQVLSSGFAEVNSINAAMMNLFGIEPSIRTTTVKPSGTVSLLMGVSPGMHWPTFTHAVRRIRQSANSPLVDVLIDAGVPYEEDVYSDNTLVFEFPISHGDTPPSTHVPLEVQAERQKLLLKEYVNNAASCTLYFDPETEASKVKDVLKDASTWSKSVSMLPHTEEGVYAQAPYSGINEEEYHRRAAQVGQIDWSKVTGKGFSDGEDTLFCDGDQCELPFAATTS